MMSSAKRQRPLRTVRHRLSRRPLASISLNSDCTFQVSGEVASSHLSQVHWPSSRRKPAAPKADSRALCAPVHRKRLLSLSRPLFFTSSSGQVAIFTPQPSSEASLCSTWSFHGKVQSAPAKLSRALKASSSRRHSSHNGTASE